MSTTETRIHFATDIQDARAFKSFFGLDELLVDHEGCCPVPTAIAARLEEFKAARDEITLTHARAEALSRIDSQAEAARLAFITPGSGQAMTYTQKEAEADALLADTSPDAASYPFLAACLGVDGDTLADVAAVVRARRDAWQSIGADIERRRLLAKQAVSNATIPTEVETTLSNLTWPQPE